jgi:hypothetical protein
MSVDARGRGARTRALSRLHSIPFARRFVALFRTESIRLQSGPAKYGELGRNFDPL